MRDSITLNTIALDWNNIFQNIKQELKVKKLGYTNIFFLFQSAYYFLQWRPKRAGVTREIRENEPILNYKIFNKMKSI